MIGALGQRPASRKHVTHRARRGFERLARAGGARIDEIVEQKMAFEQRVGVAGEPDRVGAIVLWKSRARDDAGFFVHDALHESPDRILFPDAAIQRSVDDHPDTVILDLMLLRSTRGNTARNVKPTTPAGPILFLRAAEHAQDAGIVLP